jgi:uncharacterized protein YdgA (DUF945 family)
VRKLTFVVILVAIVLLITPPLLGMRAHDQLLESVARGTQHAGGQLEMELQDYQSGWFSSHGRIQITPGDAYVKSITQDIRIAHGPLITGDSISLGLAEVVATLDAQSHPQIAQLLHENGNPHLARATVKLGFAGLGDIRLDAPPFQYRDVVSTATSVVFAGGSAHGKLDVDDMRVVLQGEINGFSVTAEDAEFVLEGLQFGMDMHYPESDPYGLGSGRVAIASAVALSETNGSAEIRVAAMEFSSSKDTAGMVSADVTYSADTANAGDVELSDLQLKLGMRNLNGRTLAHLQSLNVNSSDPGMDSTQIIPSLDEPIYDLLASGPELSISPAQFRYAGQPVKASLHVTTAVQQLPARNAFDITNPLLYASLFDIEADLSVHKELAMQAAVPALKAQLAAGVPAGAEVDQAQLENMAQAQAPMLLGTLLGQGMITEEGDNYRVRATYRGGELRVNDIPLPLGALLGAGLTGPEPQHGQ